MRAICLRTEHMRNPLGIDIRRPYLSWLCEGGITQTAYEIEASLEGEVFWKSGKVETDKMNAMFGGSQKYQAESRQHMFWKIRLWDENDIPGEWSEEAEFETGLLTQADFQAKWINPELDRKSVV